jgi:hypothetical protein
MAIVGAAASGTTALTEMLYSIKYIGRNSLDGWHRHGDFDSLRDTSFRHLIDGRLESSDGEFPVVNPATAEPLAHCPDAARDQQIYR